MWNLTQRSPRTQRRRERIGEHSICEEGLSQKGAGRERSCKYFKRGRSGSSGAEAPFSQLVMSELRLRPKNHLGNDFESGDAEAALELGKEEVGE